MSGYAASKPCASGSPRTCTTTVGSTASTWRRSPPTGSRPIELFATRSHFDYHDEAAIAALAAVADGHRAGAEQRARADPGQLHERTMGRRVLERADRSARAARRPFAKRRRRCSIARRIPFDDSRRASRNAHRVQLSRRQQPGVGVSKRRGDLPSWPKPLGVRVAFEVIPNELSSTAGRWSR